MTLAAIERVFGRSRLRMVTGKYVEVFRERAAPGERRRYTKRFLSTTEGDFREWTEREWRMLARLVGHGLRHVPDVVQFDRGSGFETALVQTYDAGVTIDHWQSLLPVERDGRVLRHVFQDCAHWWALARHFLIALEEIHRLQLVHLDLKADNVCIPLAPADFDPFVPGQLLRPDFEQIALIDFAFSLVSGESLAKPLPIGWQREYPYQSPRLLKALLAGRGGDLGPTRELDWRCDMYSLAAMLKRYLPLPERIRLSGHADGWSDDRFSEAKALVLKIRDCHDRDAPRELPHRALAGLCAAQLGRPELARSLDRGWSLAADADVPDTAVPTVPVTPVTRIERQIRPITLTDEVIMTPAGRPPAVLDTAPDTAPAAAVETAPATAPDTALPAEMPTAVPAGKPVAVPTGKPAAVPAATPAAAPAHRRIGRALAYTLAFAAVIVTLQLVNDASRPAAEPEQPAVATGRSADSVVGPRPGPPARAEEAVVSAAEPALPPSSAPDAVVAPAAAPERRDTADATPAITAGTAPEAASDTVPDTTTASTPAAAEPPGTAAEVQTAPAEPEADQFARRGSDIVNDALPAVAEQAASRVAQVLRAAADASTSAQDRQVVESARSIGDDPAVKAGFDGASAPSTARQLNAAAREAFWTRGDTAAALELQRRAFGANPRDAEIAGNLAFYHLKTSPPQPEVARRLSLHALAAASAQSRPPRLEDWGNLAVASSLSGRQQDATNAMFVVLAVSKDLNRTCRSALSAFASFGQQMKAPAEAMFARIQSRGGAPDAPHCAWPPNWSAGMKFP